MSNTPVTPFTVPISPTLTILTSNSRLHYVPLALFLFFPITFFLCYFIALGLGHINALFAFISDAGTLPPESNVFAQLMNMGAALFAYFVYIRYIQVDHYFRDVLKQKTTISNVIALAFGFITSLGMSIVGNFPELVNKELHLTGAFLAFVGCSIYTVFQGYFSFKMLPHFQTKSVAYMRTFLGILGLMLYFGAQSTILVAFHKVKNKEKLENTPDALKWDKKDGGYDYRAASVIMEWLLMVIFDIFILSFVSEFKKFKLGQPKVEFCLEIRLSTSLSQRTRPHSGFVALDPENIIISRSTSHLHIENIDDDSVSAEENVIVTVLGNKSKRIIKV